MFFPHSQAAQVPATVISLIKTYKGYHWFRIDITLISEKSLTEMQNSAKSDRTRINLVQVTGNTSISGYVDINLYFHTQKDQLK